MFEVGQGVTHRYPHGGVSGAEYGYDLVGVGSMRRDGE
jgi:hypothetical protein